MIIREKLKRLIAENYAPCVTISLPTHRTFDKIPQDEILLKNLLSVAEKQLLKRFNKRDIMPMLERLASIQSKIDMRHNLESLHIFLSNNIEEYIRSPWSINAECVQVSEGFNVRHLIKQYNRATEYLVLLVSKGGSNLYLAVNDNLEKEIRNEDFPIAETRHYVTNKTESSNAKLVDDLAKEYLNKVDKALQKVALTTNLPCVVIAEKDNYNKLMQVADRSATYVGFDRVNYNDVREYTLVKQAWSVMLSILRDGRMKAIEEIKSAMGSDKVLTDLPEIYRASQEGRGELLVVHQDFSQAMRMNTDERPITVGDEPGGFEVVYDVTGDIAWNVLSKKGRVVFASDEEMGTLGQIMALKIRY